MWKNAAHAHMHIYTHSQCEKTLMYMHTCFVSNNLTHTNDIQSVTFSFLRHIRSTSKSRLLFSITCIFITTQKNAASHIIVLTHRRDPVSASIREFLLPKLLEYERHIVWCGVCTLVLLLLQGYFIVLIFFLKNHGGFGSLRQTRAIPWLSPSLPRVYRSAPHVVKSWLKGEAMASILDFSTKVLVFLF